MATADGPKPTPSDEIFKGKTVALFAVPGAFTPTCSAKHLPSFKQQAPTLKAKGVDTVGAKWKKANVKVTAGGKG